MKRSSAVAVLMLVAAACGSGNDAESPRTDEPSTAAPSDSGDVVATDPPSASAPAGGDDEGASSAPASSEPVATAAPPAAADGTLRVGFATGLQTFDPARAGVAQITYLRPVFDALFAVDAEGALIGQLVEGYELTPESLTMQLREDVVFSDGSPLDADVVVANLKRTQAAGGAASASLARVGEIVADGPSEVSITLTSPSPTLPRDLAGLAGMMMSPVTLEDPDAGLHPVGSGPWVVESAEPGDRVVYELNASHWDAAAAGVERIEILELSDNNARSNALMSGEVDMAQLVPPQLAAVEQAGFDSLRFPDVYYGLLLLDREGALVPALGDVQVREALQHAIDREAIIEHVFFGAGTASPQPYPDDRIGFIDDFSAEFGFDPDRARELLAEAGYPDGFTLTVPAIPPTQPLVEAIAGYLADVGVQVEIAVLQPGTLAAAGQSGEYAAFVGPGLLNDPLQMYATYFSPTAVFNPFGAIIPGADDLAGALAVATDDEERADVAGAMLETIVGDGALVTVGVADLLVGSRDGVVVPGWHNDPFPDWRGIWLES